MPIDARRRRVAAGLGCVAFAVCLGLRAPILYAQSDKGAPSLVIRVSGPVDTVFTPARGCDGDDVPDVNARAFRDDRGQTVVFALHEMNRALRGPDLEHLVIDCASAFRGHAAADPAAYDDHAWIAAIWTKNGRDVSALVHHEYHAAEHPGRCISRDSMACWYNTILEIASHDGGRTFTKGASPVVAAAPFRQDVDQTRHRGFFNPSNIVAYRGAWYVFAATTGWPGQPYGACLFRSATPADPTSWRAFDGRTFAIAYHDPYSPRAPAPRPCRPVAPFGVPVGSVTRYRPNGDFFALWQAKADSGAFPTSGFYYATSSDLTHWSEPRLLLAGPTLYDDPCDSGGKLINYPSALDDAAQSRDYEDAGDRPWLYYASLRVDGCTVTSDRILLRRRLAVTPATIGAQP